MRCFFFSLLSPLAILGFPYNSRLFHMVSFVPGKQPLQILIQIPLSLAGSLLLVSTSL